jgi:hypothetical protein
VAVKDVSFNVAVSQEMRGLLTRHRQPLLNVLQTSTTTLANYVLNLLKERIVEVKAMLRAAQSKISVSVDMWMSSNNLSFLGVVAHFVGKFFKVSNFSTLSTRESSH